MKMKTRKSWLHKEPTWADAWDTALLCAGEREAARIADAENLAVIFPDNLMTATISTVPAAYRA
jgi:thiamine biosynthesis lipoprotein ApbE